MTWYPHPHESAYAQAEAWLIKGKNKVDRPLGHNRRLIFTTTGIAVRWHATHIVTYHPDGTQTLYMGGYDTVTTKRYINEYSAAHVSSAGGRKIDGVKVYTALWHPSDPRTPSKVQQCRARGCKGTGTVPYECYGPDWCYRRAPECSGDHEHLYKHSGARRSQCEHGEHKRHPAGRHKCYRCDGTGKVEYGDRPIPTPMHCYTEYRIDHTGRVLDHGWGASMQGVGKESPPAIASLHPTLAPAKPDIGDHVLRTLRSTFPAAFRDARIACPACTTRDDKHWSPAGAKPLDTLDRIIICLNDSHKWTREQVADWLDTLDLDLRFPTPA